MARSPQSLSIDISSDRCIDLNDVEKIRILEQEKGFELLHSTGNLLAVESKLCIAKVGALGEGPHAYGIFAKNTLKRVLDKDRNPVAIGEYLGDKIWVDIDGLKMKSYQFKLPNSERRGKVQLIDAERRGSWTALVNGASSESEANVCAYQDKHGETIHYYLKRDIRPGEQVLIYYGDDFEYEHSASIKQCFLNSYVSYLTPHEIVTRNYVYLPDFEGMSPELSGLFGLPPRAEFAKINTYIPEATSANIDLPILMHSFIRGEYYAADQQENITTLMLACWDGHEALIDHLLSKKASPTIQSCIKGYSALHLLIASQHGLDKKIRIMKKLIHAGADVGLQDCEGYTILHWAVKNNDMQMIRYLNETKFYAPDDIEKVSPITIASCIDKQNFDPFLLAVSLGQIDAAQYLSSFVKKDDINFYLDKGLLYEVFSVLAAQQQGLQSQETFRNMFLVFDRPKATNSKLRFELAQILQGHDALFPTNEESVKKKRKKEPLAVSTTLDNSSALASRWSQIELDIGGFLVSMSGSSSRETLTRTEPRFFPAESVVAEQLEPTEVESVDSQRTVTESRETLTRTAPRFFPAESVVAEQLEPTEVESVDSQRTVTDVGIGMTL